MDDLEKIEKLKKDIKGIISSIESGMVSEDHRGIVYKQEFGKAYIDYLKQAIE